MPGTPRIAIAHLNDNPDWAWLLPRSSVPNIWHSYQVGRYEATNAADRYASLRALHHLWRDHDRHAFDLVLSFAPAATLRVGFSSRGAKVRHDAFAFNFTDLPGRMKRLAYRQSLGTVDRAYVLTEAERSLYARTFGVPQGRFVKIDWGVAPPEPAPARRIEGDYVSALGGEARDYTTLFEAARRLPTTQFAVVARPHNLVGLDRPANVATFENLSKSEAWAIVSNSIVHVLPLRSRDTPCGIVTLVGAMHVGLAQVVTRAVGVQDYAHDGEHAVYVPPVDPAALADAIGALTRDQRRRAEMGRSAKKRAAARYDESATLRFAERLVASIG